MNPRCSKNGHGSASMIVCTECKAVSCTKCARESDRSLGARMCPNCRSNKVKSPSQHMGDQRRAEQTAKSNDFFNKVKASRQEKREQENISNASRRAAGRNDRSSLNTGSDSGSEFLINLVFLIVSTLFGALMTTFRFVVTVSTSALKKAKNKSENSESEFAPTPENDNTASHADDRSSARNPESGSGKENPAPEYQKSHGEVAHRSILQKIFYFIKEAAILFVLIVISGAIAIIISHLLPAIALRIFDQTWVKAHDGLFYAIDLCLAVAWVPACIAMIAFRYSGNSKAGAIEKHANFTKVEQKNRENLSNAEKTKAAAEHRANWSSSDPFSTLGINSSATTSEIKKAYHGLMAQYHPDKVAALGPEFRKLAEEKSKILNWAYEECLKRLAS